MASPAPKKWGVRTMFLCWWAVKVTIYIHGVPPPYMWKKLFNGFALIPRGVWIEVGGSGPLHSPPWRRHCPGYSYLESFSSRSDVSIDRNEEQHAAEAGENWRPDDLPQHVYGQSDGQRGRPDHVHVRRSVVQLLRVHRHQVHDLSHCCRFTSWTAQLQGL